MKYKVVMLLALPLGSYAATVFRYDPSPVMTTAGNVPVGGNPALYAVANATIQLCSDAACAIPATSYSDYTGAQTCPINAQVTQPGSALCTNAAGPQGQFGFWLQPGSYWYKVTANGQTSQNFAITIGTAGVISFNGRTGAVVPLPGDYPTTPPSTSTFVFTPQAPGGTISAGNNTITLTPVPAGVNWNDANHWLYLSGGTGTAEACQIRSAGPGNATSGAATGTLTLTCSNSHSGAYTVSTATAGVRECFIYVGPGGACYTPTGQWAFYATIYDDAQVDWTGNGPSSLMLQEFTGNGVWVGTVNYPPVGLPLFVNIRNIEVYNATGYTGSGAAWTFQNMPNGVVDSLTAFLGDIGFQFLGSTGITYNNLLANSNTIAFHWICSTGGGCAAGGNAGLFTNIGGTVQAGGTVAKIEPTIEGLTIQINTSGGQYGMAILPNLSGIINELLVHDGFLDSATSAALYVPYSAGGSSLATIGNTVGFVNNRFTVTTGTPVGAAYIDAPLSGWMFSNNAFYNSANYASYGLVVKGLTNSTFVGNQFGVANAGAAPLLIGADDGSDVSTNLRFNGNQFGFIGVNPTNAVSCDGSANTGIYGTGNSFNGMIACTAWVNSFFDQSNSGIQSASVATASSVKLPGFPDLVFTGTTTVTAVTNQLTGAHGTFTTAAAGFSLTSGASIANSCTVATGSLYQWYSDGTKLHVSGPGCS